MRSPSLGTVRWSLVGLCALFAVSPACSDNPGLGADGGDGSDSGSDGSDSGTDGADSGDSGDGGDLGLDGGLGDGSGASGNGSGGSGPVCETASSEAILQPIYLAFAFDVSGSMGHYDRPRWWHDPDAKWIPVVEATTAFFQDQASAGISASMALFPSSGDSTTKCSASTYESPEVVMAQLPSNDFADVFDAYEEEVGSPLAGGNWRGGTPTLAAFTGTATYLQGFQGANPDAKFAVVLVTDGLPQSCSNAGVQEVTDAVSDLYTNDSVPTYVIGIENPTTPPSSLPSAWPDWGNCDDPDDPGGDDTPCSPPENLSALNGIASAGGTDSAFLIDTGDPVATQTAFRAAIDAIRAQAISCDLGIPDHPTPGMSFDKDKIDVSVTVDGDTTRLDYDPDCEQAGSWRYDDQDEPSMIQLCPAACTDIQSQPGADLNVDFLCEVRPDVVK